MIWCSNILTEVSNHDHLVALQRPARSCRSLKCNSCRHCKEFLMELVAVGVSSDFRRLWNLDTSKAVDAPAFAPLAMGGHVALEREKKQNTN